MSLPSWPANRPPVLGVFVQALSYMGPNLLPVCNYHTFLMVRNGNLHCILFSFLLWCNLVVICPQRGDLRLLMFTLQISHSTFRCGLGIYRDFSHCSVPRLDFNFPASVE